jgi:3''-deamino-3''-oxonicotianamine reductase
MASAGTTAVVPEVALRSGNARTAMPMVGMGTASFPLVHEAVKDGVLSAIEVGFRHFDTASMYGTEKPLGDAVAEALRRGTLRSREDLFVTSKLWCSQNHPDLVLPSLRETLK